MIGCSFVVDREYFRDIGLLDPGMEVYGAENIELGMRVSRQRADMIWEAKIVHRGGPEALSCVEDYVSQDRGAMGVLASNFQSEALPVSQSNQMEPVCLLVLQTVISCHLCSLVGGIAWENLILEQEAQVDTVGEKLVRRQTGYSSTHLHTLVTGGR